MAELQIDLEKLRHNCRFLVHYCGQFGLEITGILKGPEYDSIIIGELMDCGIEEFGLSHLPATLNNNAIFHEKPTFIALPSIHHVETMVHCFGTSFNSEISVIKRINEVVSVKRAEHHNIILMVDVGDLREGIHPDKVLDTVKEIHDIKNRKVSFAGIGTNLGCYAGLIPSAENIAILQDLASDIEERQGIQVKEVSVGGSLLLKLLETHHLPAKINKIRIGEALFLGRIPTIDIKHEELHDDVLIFRSDVLETQEKIVDPPEHTGKNALGLLPEFRHRGRRQRAILNFGITDTYPEGLTPLLQGMEVVCVNSGYTIVDYTDSPVKLSPGDFVEFKMNYLSMLQSFICPFTRRTYRHR